MASVLEVRNLRVSFRTDHGNVRAVRGISFELNKGETLAIVGESGSGKSVTAKSIIGINAANAILEGGEIIYKGQDLLKLTEKELNRVRGNELTMVFQDPLSSLDPIMKIGKQMTEATLINNKTKRRNAKEELRFLRKQLRSYMKKAGCADSALTPENVAKALRKADEEKRAVKARAADELEKALPTFEKTPLDEKETSAAAKRLAKLVEASIDPVALEKNSWASTFRSSLEVDLRRYFQGLKSNPREEKRVQRETAK
ncbi:MAG: ATP-binding cassette domain-containing protein, partial [Oscillospiraceae bacterium]